MKKNIFAGILISVPSVFAAAQNEKSFCPKIEVKGGGVVSSGQALTFTASLYDAVGDFQFEYKWKASAGTIVSGQETPSIVVDTTGLASKTEIAAIIKVKGFLKIVPIRPRKLGRF